MRTTRILALAGVTAASALAALGGSPAAADPGRCGVRNGDTGTAPPTYFIRNKCGHDERYRVHSVHGNSNCKTVPAGEVVGYLVYGLYDPNWSIQGC